MNPLASLAVAFALSFVAESGTEYIFGTPMDKIEKLAPYKWALMYVGLAAGIGMCWYWQVDLIGLIQSTAQGADFSAVTPLGVIVTGLMVGRGANYLHQFVSQYLPMK